jgi:hypothetical protein
MNEYPSRPVEGHKYEGQSSSDQQISVNLAREGHTHCVGAHVMFTSVLFLQTLEKEVTPSLQSRFTDVLTLILPSSTRHGLPGRGCKQATSTRVERHGRPWLPAPGQWARVVPRPAVHCCPELGPECVARSGVTMSIP